ncbi:MAG: xanthine dehydrogenase family protein, partial [Spirochaetota bacterium]
MSDELSPSNPLKVKDLYIDDFFEKDMLYAVLLRSTIRRGKIKRINLPDRLPEHVKIISAHNIPGVNLIEVFNRTVPLLAFEQVNYIGEPILIAAGPNEKELLSILLKISVEYQEEAALPAIHGYTGGQVVYKRRVHVGDVQRKMKEAFQIVEAEYSTNTRGYHPSNPLGAFTRYEGQNIAVYSPSLWPFHVRNSVALATGLNKSSVIVRVPETTKPADGKIWYPSLLAVYAALITVKTGRTTRLILSNSEQNRFLSWQSPIRIRYKTGLNKDGDPVVMDIEVVIDMGAYPVFTDEIIDRVCIGAAGLYTCKDVRIQGMALRTNNPPLAAFEGFGLSEAIFAVETHASRIAELVQNDPYTWKKRNSRKKDNLFITGGSFAPAPPIDTLLDHVVKQSDFMRKHAAYEMVRKRRENIFTTTTPLRGIGLSQCYQGDGFIGAGEERAPYSVIVRLEADSRLTLLTSGVSISGMAYTMWKRVAEQILGIPLENIDLEAVDTSLVPDSGPSILSRNIIIIAKLIERGCQAIQKKRFRSPLPIEIKRIYHLPSSHKWNGKNFTGTPFPSLSWG